MIDEGENHLHELSKLAEKDPEFFKYLQENDQELLNFDPKAIRAEVQSEDGDGVDPMEEDGQIPVLTKDHLRTWQKALLEARINTLVHIEISLTFHLATVPACPSKVVNSFPFCRSHA